MSSESSLPETPATASPAEPRPDREVSLAFLRKARATGFHVLVSIDPEAPHGDPSKARAASFAAREADAAGDWVERENGERRRNVYWTVNRVGAPIARKPSKADVVAVEFLYVDVDPDKRRPLAEERARLERLISADYPRGVPPPSLVVDSGGGFQLFWRLEEALPVAGDPVAVEEAERRNEQLEALFGADACHNVDRIMRVPGTVNWPDARKAAAGRVPRLAELRSSTDAAYPASAFMPAPARQAPELGFVAPRAAVETGNVARLASVDELGPKVSDDVKVVVVQGHDPDNPRRWPSRSEPLFWVVCEMIRAGTPDDVIYSVITDPGFGISESVLDKGSRAERYALQQIEHAHAEADAEGGPLAELNLRHAVVANVGGRCRVLCEDLDGSTGRAAIVYQTFEDFRNRYSNRFVEDGDRRIPLADWWIRHPERRHFDRVVFSPGATRPGDYNLWRGFDCRARPGDCSLYLRHLRDNVCRGDEALLEYLLSWMAFAAQRPGERGHVAVVLRGERGTGKGKAVEWFGGLFGRHFMQLTNPAQLVGQFNHHLKDCVVLFADEALYAGDKRHEAVLKALVTEREIATEAKYHAAEMSRNCLHVIMAANQDWVVPAGGHERRFLVLDVGDGNRQDRAFFGALDEQMRAGGREALLHLLLTRDLSAFDARAVPRTAALQEQKEHSLSIEEEWWLAKLRAGQVRDGEEWPPYVAASELQWDFARYAQAWGRGQRASATRLGRLLDKAGARRRQLGGRITILTDEGVPRSVDRPRVFELPALSEARAAWARLMGGEFDWSTPVLETAADERPYA